MIKPKDKSPAVCRPRHIVLANTTIWKGQYSPSPSPSGKGHMGGNRTVINPISPVFATGLLQEILFLCFSSLFQLPGGGLQKGKRGNLWLLSRQGPHLLENRKSTPASTTAQNTSRWRATRPASPAVSATTAPCDRAMVIACASSPHCFSKLT